MSANTTSVSSLQRLVGCTFSQPDLLRQAFIHKSYLNENPGYELGSNERLEFLGDAFLGYVVAAELYRAEPTATEGELTKRRAALVQRDTLAEAVRSRGWGAALVMGQGEESKGGRSRTSILANLYEAILGAILLDQGEVTARAFVLDTLRNAVQDLEAGTLAVDYKSMLQEFCQSQRWDSPTYRVLAESGPAHAKQFEVEVLVQGAPAGHGAGSSRRRAEKDAARVAWDTFHAAPVTSMPA